MVMLGFTVRVVVPRGESTVMVGTVGKLRLFVSWIGRVWDMVEGRGIDNRSYSLGHVLDPWTGTGQF